MTTDEAEHLVRRLQADASADAAAQTRANRRAALKDIPRIQQLIRQASAPFGPGEAP